MFKITNRLILGKDVKRVEIFAPQIARKAKPGQFVIVIPEERMAGVPLAIVETDPSRGNVTLIFQEGHPSAKVLGEIPIGESIFAVVGPLGNPATIQKFGTVLCVASGTGTAQILPVCRALKECGNKVMGVLGAKSKSKMMLEPQVRMACHKMFIATEDGSFERRGAATDVVADLLAKEDVAMVYCVGSVTMMEKVCSLTRERGVKTLIQVSAGISCGVGICASCRIEVAGETILACQKGPEFDGHEVDFKVLKVRREGFKKLQIARPGAGLDEDDNVSQTVAKFFPGGLGK